MEASDTIDPSARRITLSRCPAPTKRSRARAGVELGQRRGDVFLRRRRGVQQVAGVRRPATAATRHARAARAASPACCSSAAPPAGPCPTRRRRTAAGGASPSGAGQRQRVVVVAAAAPRRTVARGQLVAVRLRQRRRETGRPGCARPASSRFPASPAPAPPPGAAPAAARARCAAWIVRSNRRAFSIAVAVCSASVFSSFSSAAV